MCGTGKFMGNRGECLGEWGVCGERRGSAGEWEICGERRGL